MRQIQFLPLEGLRLLDGGGGFRVGQGFHHALTPLGRGWAVRGASRLSEEEKVGARSLSKRWHSYRIYAYKNPSPSPNTQLQLFGAEMNITIFGIVGHRSVEMPLEKLDIDELEVGREFLFRGKVYEIRSIADTVNGFLINVILIME